MNGRRYHRVDTPGIFLNGLFGARRGPYRILYPIDADANRVEILRIDHRSDVYRSD